MGRTAARALIGGSAESVKPRCVEIASLSTARRDICARQGPKLADGHTRMRQRRLLRGAPASGPVHRRFVERRSLVRTGAASAGGIEGGIEGGIAEGAADRL